MNTIKSAVKPDSTQGSDPEETAKDYQSTFKDKFSKIQNLVKSKRQEEDAIEANKKTGADSNKVYDGPEETGAKPKTRAVSFRDKIQSAIFPKNTCTYTNKSNDKPKVNLIKPANLNNWEDNGAVDKPPINKTKSVEIKPASINNWKDDKVAISSGDNSNKTHNNGLTNHNYTAGCVQNRTETVANLNQWGDIQPARGRSTHIHSSQVKNNNI